MDRGLGFWTEHHKLWEDNGWFAITTTENEFAVSQVLDRYIMRQNTILSLTIHPECVDTYEYKFVLRAAGIGLLPTAWPEKGEAAPEQDCDAVDRMEPKISQESDDMQRIDDSLYEKTTVESLAATYELQGQGQTRYWIKQQPESCCLASFIQITGTQTLCRNARRCLFCSAEHFEE